MIKSEQEYLNEEIERLKLENQILKSKAALSQTNRTAVKKLCEKLKNEPGFVSPCFHDFHNFY